MGIKVKRKGRTLERLARELPKEKARAEATAVTKIIASIKARVKDNVSHTGSGFKPLTPKYKKHKESKGLKERFVYSGKMMKQMTWRRIPDGVRIFFKGLGDTKAAASHYKYGRPFLNVNKTEANFLKRELVKALRKLNR